MYFVYALRCIDSKRGRKKFYVGVTNNIEERAKKHKGSCIKTTKSYDKIELIYYEAYLNKADAIKREKALKTGFGRGYLKRRLKHYLKNKRL